MDREWWADGGGRTISTLVFYTVKFVMAHATIGRWSKSAWREVSVPAPLPSVADK